MFCNRAFLPLLVAAGLGAQEIVSVERIWDYAPHNAFTDLIRFKDHWYCTFREGRGHVSPDGALRVLVSPDGKEWKSAALITSALGDLRDPKITVRPDNRLMLTSAVALSGDSPYKHRSLAWFSADGADWGEPVSIGHPNLWLWRVTWHKGAAYSVGYATAGQKFARLYRSTNGVQFTPLVDRLFEEGYPNESSMVFLKDDTAYCLLRRDDEGAVAMLGTARPPYREWTWKPLNVRFGGPHMLRLPDGRFLAAGRLYDGKVRTALCWLDPEKAVLREFLPLPSGGDTSYPGLVLHKGQLWVSYYSSHEGRTSIYLARVKLR